jgi:hypothetical protein
MLALGLLGDLQVKLQEPTSRALHSGARVAIANQEQAVSE